MRKAFPLIVVALAVLVTSCAQRAALVVQRLDAASEAVVRVDPGTFAMGDVRGDLDAQPVHNVTLTRPYLVGKYEISVAQFCDVANFGVENGLLFPYQDEASGRLYILDPTGYAIVMTDFVDIVYRENLFVPAGGREGYPVTNITWYGALQFCNTLSVMQGLTPCYSMDFETGALPNYAAWDPTADGFRLPTEAEWEYAAIGGASSQGFGYSGSDDASAAGWHDANALGASHPAGQFAPNELGLYDMSGNVTEWCWDIYDNRGYRTGDTVDPAGPASIPVDDERRVRRGGSYMDGPSYLASRARRNPGTPGYWAPNIGLRVVRTIFE